MISEPLRIHTVAVVSIDTGLASLLRAAARLARTLERPASQERRPYICNNGSMTGLRLTRVGNSVGVVLPKETLARLKLDVGDTVYLTESPDGFRLTPYDPEFAAQFSVAEKVMKRRRAALRELAK